MVLLSLGVSFLDERSPELVWFLPVVTEHEVLATVSRQTVVNHNFLPLPEPPEVKAENTCNSVTSSFMTSADRRRDVMRKANLRSSYRSLGLGELFS